MTFGTHDHTGAAVPITFYPKQKAWSYSSVKQHDTCPAVIRYRKIDKLGEPKSAHLQRGIDVHAAVEAVITGDLTDNTHLFPSEWMGLFHSLRLAGALIEVQAAFTREWMHTEWFGPDAWLRVVIDCILVEDTDITIWEWKTGKKYDDHPMQGRLYALAALLLYPQATTVDVKIRYLDRYPEGHDVIGYTQAHLPSLKDEFTKFSHDYLNDTIYPARPNRYCRNCHFRKSNEGPCAHG